MAGHIENTVAKHLPSLLAGELPSRRLPRKLTLQSLLDSLTLVPKDMRAASLTPEQKRFQMWCSVNSSSRSFATLASPFRTSVLRRSCATHLLRSSSCATAVSYYA